MAQHLQVLAVVVALLAAACGGALSLHRPARLPTRQFLLKQGSIDTMATALYRQYRPESFSEMIGQQHVTEPLMAALRNGKIGHAYLFSGPRGCGKTTSARIMARCLNCAQGPTDTPCGTCPSCVDLSRNGSGSLDVVEIDAASHGGVEDARELRERASYAPARDRYKIFIIDEAHMVTSQGFNALLKIVEEPPPYLKFIFATTEPEKVLGTIRSRTQHYPFRLIAPAAMMDYVAQLCVAENVQLAEGVLPLLARAGAGSARDTLSILDQLVAGAQNGTVTLETATGLLGYTSDELITEVVAAFAAADAPGLFAAVDRVVQTGQDPRRFTEDLLLRLRDLLLAGAGTLDHARAVLRALPAAAVQQLHEQARLFTPGTLSALADVIYKALNEMGGATPPRLQLELMLARALTVLETGGASVAGTGTSKAAAVHNKAADQVATAAQPTSVPSVSGAKAASTAVTPEAPPATQAMPAAVTPVQEPAAVHVQEPAAAPAPAASPQTAAGQAAATSAPLPATSGSALADARNYLQAQMNKISKQPASELLQDLPAAHEPAVAVENSAMQASAQTTADTVAVAAPAQQAAPAAGVAPEESAAPAVTEPLQITGEELAGLWQQVLEEVTETQNALLPYVQTLTPLEIKQDTFLVSFAVKEQAFAFRQHAADTVRELLYEATGAQLTYQVKLGQAGAAAVAATATPAKSPAVAAGPAASAPAAPATPATPETPAVSNAAPPGSQLPTSAWAVSEDPHPLAVQAAAAAPETVEPTAQPTPENTPAPALPEIERVGESVIRQVFNPKSIN